MVNAFAPRGHKVVSRRPRTDAIFLSRVNIDHPIDSATM